MHKINTEVVKEILNSPEYRSKYTDEAKKLIVDLNNNTLLTRRGIAEYLKRELDIEIPVSTVNYFIKLDAEEGEKGTKKESKKRGQKTGQKTHNINDTEKGPISIKRARENTFFDENKEPENTLKNSGFEGGKNSGFEGGENSDKSTLSAEEKEERQRRSIKERQDKIFTTPEEDKKRFEQIQDKLNKTRKIDDEDHEFYALYADTLNYIKNINR